MKEAKTDPRILRTRKLIIDAFIELSSKKEFKHITIKDITTEAMINRATFYYHFEDIYDLLDKVLSEVLLVNLNSDLYESDNLTEEVFVSIFTAITNFQKSLSTRCYRGYEDTIGRIIMDQLEIIFYKMLCKQNKTDDDEGLRIHSVILSWGIYGASVEWRRNGMKASPDEFIKSAIPYLINGTN
ncbi:TetR/AcrR family transcriptional regulator [Lysinibacillus endophyticus]|uniref:TetR/AcrR family transcriptional regulator n=1 Tax=Ureibacillus endophyticus TaxID=1978490 RepID=UPI003134B7C8